MKGGSLFETGAGGSAPKHVQQFEYEGHLRWDSLGEFLALAVSFDHIHNQTGNKKAGLLAQTLDEATAQYLLNAKAPSRKVNELDNRGSQFYLAMYWAQALVNQTEDTELSTDFADLARALADNEATILAELLAAQGAPVDVGGYYLPDEARVTQAMRPSATFNRIMNGA